MHWVEHSWCFFPSCHTHRFFPRFLSISPNAPLWFLSSLPPPCATSMLLLMLFVIMPCSCCCGHFAYTPHTHIQYICATYAHSDNTININGSAIISIVVIEIDQYKLVKNVPDRMWLFEYIYYMYLYMHLLTHIFICISSNKNAQNAGFLRSFHRSPFFCSAARFRFEANACSAERWKRFAIFITFCVVCARLSVFAVFNACREHQNALRTIPDFFFRSPQFFCLILQCRIENIFIFIDDIRMCNCHLIEVNGKKLTPGSESQLVVNECP